jgi:hypothetical protein
MGLRAPVEFFEQLDKWREHYKSEHEMVMAPSRPATIRWIVWTFLQKQQPAPRAHRRRPK